MRILVLLTLLSAFSTTAAAVEHVILISVDGVVSENSNEAIMLPSGGNS